jgi:hypothetical protein
LRRVAKWPDKLPVIPRTKLALAEFVIVELMGAWLGTRPGMVAPGGGTRNNNEENVLVDGCLLEAGVKRGYGMRTSRNFHSPTPATSWLIESLLSGNSNDVLVCRWIV